MSEAEYQLVYYNTDQYYSILVGWYYRIRLILRLYSASIKL